jgi:site-specific DNA-cytosine methylase
MRSDCEPVFTVGASQGHRPLRAFIVGDQNRQLAFDAELVNTVRTFSEGGGLPRAWLSHGRVVQMTPRALARFQSFPDWYQLPSNNALAVKGIGNAVPPLLMQRIGETFTCS